MIPSPTQTATPTLTLLPPYPTAPPIPAWITNFADPILAKLANRKPDFQDDFSINRGWFYVVNSGGEPVYAERYDGTLLLRLPEEAEDRDSMVYNPKLIRKNFVLSLDLRFEHAQPDDTVRFQFNQTTDQSVVLDLTNNNNWNFHWDFHNNWQSNTGTFEHFPPEPIVVTIVMQGNQCAVYLNNAPLDYLSDCRSGPIVQSSRSAVSFHAFATTRHAVTVNFDNLRLWDLDKTPGHP
jgi:hypothetical protein